MFKTTNVRQCHPVMSFNTVIWTKARLPWLLKETVLANSGHWSPTSSCKHNHSQNHPRWKHLVFGLCVATNPMAYELTSVFSTTG